LEGEILLPTPNFIVNQQVDAFYERPIVKAFIESGELTIKDAPDLDSALELI
jgi:hypothetical protein